MERRLGCIGQAWFLRLAATWYRFLDRVAYLPPKLRSHYPPSARRDISNTTPLSTIITASRT
jgi:hypothetical protein